MIRPIDETVVHALVMVFAEALGEVNFGFRPEELAVAVHRYAGHTNYALLKGGHSPFMRDFLKLQASTVLMNLQSGSAEAIDGGLVPPGQTTGDEVV